MGVTQYIGPRIVPLFADPDEWTNTRTYEPLTIVLHEGNSFTSKQFVPVGIDISNDEFWAETGNYNGQVEAYRREVLGFDKRISDTEEKIDDISNETVNTEIKIHTPNAAGSISLITTENAAVCIDCGRASDITTKIPALFANENISKLDGLVITHFHSDHFTGLEGVLNFCDANTDIFIQMAPTNVNDEYETYQNGINTLQTAINARGLKQPIVPTTGETYNYSDMMISFLNTNEAFKGTYDSCKADNGNFTDGKSGINNYSLITRIDYKGSSYIDCGDIEGEAERLNSPFMQKCTVMKNPHHWANYMGYLDFFENANANIITVNQPKEPSDTVPTTDITTVGQIFNSYLYRFLMVEPTKCFDNSSKDIIIRMKEGNIFYADGTIIEPNALNGAPNAQAFLPAWQYYENPYEMRNLEVKDLVAFAIRSNTMRKYTLLPTSDFWNDSNLYKSIKALFSPYFSDTTLWQFQIITGMPYLRFEQNSSQLANNIVDVYPTYDGTSENGLRRYNHNWSGFKFESDSALTRGDSIPNEIYNNTILHAPMINVQLDDTNNTVIPLVATNTPEYNNSVKNYEGVVFTPTRTSTILATARFTGRTLSYCKLVNVTDGSITEAGIIKVWVP